MIKIILIIAVVLSAIMLIWRLLSSWVSLPCPTWLGWMVEMDNPFSKINRSQTLVKHLELQPGMKVLDVGCGPGRLTIPVARAIRPNGIVVALDIQQGMLDKVKKKAQKDRLNNIEYLLAGVGESKLEHNRFDRALLVTVLGEIPNQQLALKEIYDALKPGGVLCIAEIILDPHYQRYNKTLQLAERVGFRKKDIFTDWCAYSLLLEKPI